MADNAAFSSPKEKGPPKWLMIGGAVAGVLGLVVLISRNSGSNNTATTAAGTSINAALGSLQEEQMNLLGTVQAGAMQNTANFQATSGQISDTTTSILDAITAQGQATQQQITDATSTINANTNSNNQGLMAQLTQWVAAIQGNEANILSQVQSVNNNVTTVGNQVTGVSGQVSGLTNQVASNWSTSQSQMANMLQEIQTTAQQANAANVSASELQNLTNNIGSFLGWEWYQIPNRYTPYLPGASASNPYGNLNVATIGA